MRLKLPNNKAGLFFFPHSYIFCLFSLVILNDSEFFINLPLNCRLILWDCLFAQLEFGGFELKEHSFSLVLCLFKNNLVGKFCLPYSLDAALAVAEWFLERWDGIPE